MKAEPWERRRIGEFCRRVKRTNLGGRDLEPFSITKDRGVIWQSDKYKKRIATDPKKYLVGKDGDFAFDPMSLYYGAIGRIRDKGEGLISPDYVTLVADSSVDHDFLSILLRDPEMHKIYAAHSETGNSFGKRRRLYWSVLEQIELNLPPSPSSARSPTSCRRWTKPLPQLKQSSTSSRSSRRP